jgi:hypothetical protein
MKALRLGLLVAAACTIACAATPRFQYTGMTAMDDKLYIFGTTYRGDHYSDSWVLRCTDNGRTLDCEEINWYGKTPVRQSRTLGSEQGSGMHETVAPEDWP